MKKKQTLALLLAGAMLVPNAFAASPEDFHDFPTDWSAAGLRSAVQNGLLNGSNGEIDGNGLLTRAQLAAIVNRAFGADKAADLSGFTDVRPDAWYHNDMAVSVAMGAFQGANGKLNPESPITREEAFAVLARAFGLDGDASALSDYTDGGSVSPWAKSAVSALIDSGFVNGANGRLNPRSSITRAEFAKVISGMASTFADNGLSDTVDGNVIVRSSGASLAGKTINGDLILADGAAQADLTNVTVTGRILIRGGADGVTFGNTSAGRGIIVHSDVSIAGTADSITVAGAAAVTVQSGASVGSITVNAENAKITGAGKVGEVRANADNVSVSTSGTRVSASENVSGVQAGSKTVAAGKTETVSQTPGGSSSGGSSNGGSSNGGGSSSNNDQNVNAEIADAKVVTTDAGAYLALSFKDGFKADAATVTVDGADVTAAVSRVTDDGAVSKLPLTAKPGSVTLTSGGRTQTISLGTAQANAVYTGEDYLPDYFIKHGPLAMWDYYLTNYDDAGSVRVLPAKTTFGTSAVRSEHPSYSEPLVLDEDGKGNVVVMFNYNTEEEKAWFDSIADFNEDNTEGAVQLVAYDQEKNTWNRNLQFTKGLDDHNGNKVATLTIPFGQSNFRSNGRYFVRVTSANAQGVKSSALASIHVQNHDTPKLRIKEPPTSGRNLHFAVSNLVYGITDPIEKVTLTDPTGKTTALEKITDYYLFSQDLFVLYNDTNAESGASDHLKYQGEYTLTIQANGFKTFSCTFNVKEGAQPAQLKAVTYDAVSRATGSTSSGSGSSDSSGGYAVSTDFLFDSDLVANACVLNKLGRDTADSAAVLEYWNYSASTLDSVFNKGDTMYYDGTDYIDATNKALWVPFSEFVKTAEAGVYPPHATKAVLEDGLLGDIQDSTVSGRLDYIVPTVSGNQQGSDAVLTFENDTDYLGKISALYLNGDWRELDEKYYSIKGNVITLSKDLLHVGENALKIVSNGYKTQTVEFTYGKVNEENLSLSAEVNKDAQTVTLTVNGSNGDFLKNLTSVKLGEDTVYGKGVEGSDAVYYVLGADNKTISLYNVKPGSYQLTLSAKYYEDLTAEFTMKKVDTPDTKTAPEISSYEQKSISDFVGTQYPVYRFSFNGLNATDLKGYLNAVTSVKVNKTTLTKNTSSFSFDEKEFRLYSTGSENGGAMYDYDRLDLFASLFKQPGTYTITLTAPDYADVSYELTVSGSTEPTEPTDPTEPGESEVKVPTELPAITKGSNAYCTLTFSNAEKWLAQSLTVTVNDVAYDKTGSIYNLDNGGAYYIEKNNISLKIPYESFDSKTSMLVISDGTSTINFTVTVPGSFSFGAEPTIAFTK
ncbi:hemoblobin-interacting domain-containing protein [Agathobaculum sp.]|uniref:hemoblobin-interacting domain-containing protein n=1 Tax=Agathobaculum sp. TaxID=2048138 RepID=UPI003FD8BA05